MKDDDAKIESMLQHYQPLGPPTELQQRIFSFRDENPPTRSNRRLLAMAAFFAVILLGGVVRLWIAPSGASRDSRQNELAFEDIQREMAQSASAARLLVSADTLARQPGGEAIAQEQYRYIAQKYPGSAMAKDAMARLKLIF